jgi:predicted RNase H-like HicB family nuclease
MEPHLRTERSMSEIIFVVEEAPEGGYTARALGESIFTQGDSLDELRRNIREAVECHFQAGDAPKIIRLHFVREEVIPA